MKSTEQEDIGGPYRGASRVGIIREINQQMQMSFQRQEAQDSFTVFSKNKFMSKHSVRKLVIDIGCGTHIDFWSFFFFKLSFAVI